MAGLAVPASVGRRPGRRSATRGFCRPCPPLHLDLHRVPEIPGRAGGFLAGREGAGSVHHIAFRADDDADQAAMVKLLTEEYGQRVTGQIVLA